MMERTLEVQWMINGHGGYTVHRWSIVLPPTHTVMFAVSLIAWAWVMWTFHKAAGRG